MSTVEIPNKDNLPPELLELKQFIIWHEVKKGDKLDKVPCAPWATKHWGPASATDSANWTTYDEAAEYAKKGEGYGVGFAFKGGIVGIDLDKCINGGGVINEFARNVIQRAQSYCELSPSERGVHVFLLGKLSKAIVAKERGVEAYDEGRYFTVTGRRFKDAPKGLRKNNGLLKELLEKFGKNETPMMAFPDVAGDIKITDVVSTDKLTKRERKEGGDEYQGAHPIHGSDTGMNFAINPSKNTWFCFRHWTGGDPLSWLAVKEGIIKCEEAGKKSLRGGKFEAVMELAKKQGLQVGEEKKKITDKFITDTILGKHLFYCDITDVNKILYLFTGDHWNNAAAESVILNEISDIFKEEEGRRGMVLECTVNFVKGQAMNRKVEPKPHELIPFKNGLYNLTTGKLKPHDSKYFYANVIPHDHDQKARCPKWMKWMGEVTKPEDVDFIQEWMGYNLYTDYPEACFVILIGVGQNAKSVFNVLFKKMVGKKNVTEISLADLTYDDFSPAQIEHKLANISDDIGSTVIKSTSRLKRMSAGSGMTVAKKFQREHDIIPYAKPTYSCNEPPEIRDDSDAIKMRLRVIEFPYVFAKKPVEGQKQARDRKEVDKELEEEIPGIINWALKGLKRFLNNNATFSGTRSTDETWKFYQRKSRPVFSFMDDAITITDDETEKATIEVMYAALKEWLKKNNVKLRIGRSKMIRDLRDEGLETRQKREDERKRVYYGVTLSRDYFNPTYLESRKDREKEKEKIEKGGKEGNKKRVTACHPPEDLGEAKTLPRDIQGCLGALDILTAIADGAPWLNYKIPKRAGVPKKICLDTIAELDRKGYVKLEEWDDKPVVKITEKGREVVK